MKPLRGVLVGTGYFSQFHLESWLRLPRVELTAVCDRDLSAATRVAEAHGIAAAYDDFESLLDQENPDFVDIVTRPDSHLALVRTAAAREHAIICQKPLAPTFAEARQLVDAAASHGAPLMVHENFRFQPWHREIRRLLDSGTIGDRLHTISLRTRTGDGWRPDAYLERQPYFRDMPRFLVHETGVHFIDTLRYLAGEIDTVFASLRRLNEAIKGEDAATILFELAGGAVGIWDANRYNEADVDDPRFTFCEALIEGNGGTVRLDADGNLEVQRLGESAFLHDYAHERRGFAGDCVHATQTHFVDCLTAGRDFETSGSEYLKTLAVVEAIYESARTRQPVRGLNQN